MLLPPVAQCDTALQKRVANPHSPANKTEDPDGFYSTDTYTERLLEYLDGRTEQERSQPFFGFLPYTAPHWPLQCSKAARDKCVLWACVRHECESDSGWQISRRL